MPTKDCCFAEIEARPPRPQTGYSHPKCYARALQDCSDKLSLEHFASKSVLKLFAPDARLFAPFLPKEGKSLRVDATGSNVLCVRHNSALSRIDDLALKYFQFVLGLTSHEFLIIRGFELER